VKKSILRFAFYTLFYPVSRLFLALERLVCWKEVRHWIDHTPRGLFTGISFDNYTWWVYNQGFFTGLIGSFSPRTDLKILDWGCGMGKLAPVCYFWVKDNGKYLGIDTDIPSIDLCRKTYGDLRNCEFYLTKDQNAFYKNPGIEKEESLGVDWPVEKASQDLLIASSVFTHLQEAESTKYMQRIHEVLVPGGLAILSFHVIRDHVNANPTFNFTHPLTSGWFTSVPDCPEYAIGVKQETIEKLIKDKFSILKWLEGHSTGGRSPSFQDIFVLKKI